MLLVKCQVKVPPYWWKGAVFSFPADNWDNVFKNGPSKICGKQPLKKLKGYGLHNPSNFLKAVFHRF